MRFNATNFSVAGGIANTIQNIATTSTPTFGGATLNGTLSVTAGGANITGNTVLSAALAVQGTAGITVGISQQPAPGLVNFRS